MSQSLRSIARARLPAWTLPGDWPVREGEPVLADLRIEHGRLATLTPAGAGIADAWDLEGALVLPGLVDIHVHLDKAFTAGRARATRPGLLGAIEAMIEDRERWTPADLRARAMQGLRWAFEAGVTRVRTHVDWFGPDGAPPAWEVLGETAREWSDRIRLERVGFAPLRFFAAKADARSIARRIADSAGGTAMGGFIHTSNHDDDAILHLVEAAGEAGLELDLHADEELDPAARGIETTLAAARATGYDGKIAFGHACALAAKPETEALSILDQVARAGATLVALPLTNLLLQDARACRTPRFRGITLVKEARGRGIPVLFASDNVRDPFCALGSFDPLEALAAAVPAAQLEAPFDRWSDAICGGPGAAFLSQNPPADFVVFESSDAASWPSRAGRRTIVRGGRRIAIARDDPK